MLALVAWCLAFVQDCPDCHKAPDVEPPVVALRVLTGHKADANGLITYEVILQNRAAAKAFDVKVKLELPEKTALHKASVDPEVKDKLLTWNIGTMPGHCHRSFTVTLKTTADGPLEVCFRVSYEHGVCVTTTAACKPKAADETLPAPKKPMGELTVQKIGPARQGMGTPILYSISVTNSGKTPLQSVELDDLLPANSIYVPGSADTGGQPIGPEGKKMQWKLGTMLPGESRTVSFKVRPTQTGTYVNVANARGLDPDNQTVQSKDTMTTTDISGMATLYMEVKDSVDPLFVGQPTSYTVLIRNTGTATASNIRLQADIPAGLIVTRIGPTADADASGFKSGDPRINFPAFNLDAKQERTFQIEARSDRPNLYRFRTVLTADVLDPNKPAIIEEETTQVVAEKPPDAVSSLEKSPAGVLTKR
jgi:uncharacterized repeat protein (TIGR01451 family)